MARFPVPTFTPPTSGTVEQRIRVLADALSRKADQTLEPVYSAVLLMAPGGAVYRLSVDDTGLLTTAAVART